MSESLLFIGPLLACAVAALIAIPVFRRLGGHAGWVLALAPALGFAAFAAAAPAVLSGTVPTLMWDWVPGLDLDLAFRLDPWSLLLALVVTGVGAPLLVYAGGYAADDPRGGRMIAMLALFAAAMLGLVLSNHLLMIYVFWEATSVLSFLLVGHKHEQADARAAARRAMVITIAGGLALLAGLLLIGNASDSWLLTDILAAGSLSEHPHYLWMVLCIVAAAATKSAQFPFHVWLPGAMAAPTPVSCYLHAATMVKAGVFLLGALAPVLAGTGLWLGLVGGIGAVTAVWAAVRTLAQRDAKGLVAWSTVSALGLMVALLGIGTPLASTALVVLLVAHAAYKATLFMVVGAIDHGTGTRDLDRLGGLRPSMPWTAATALLAGASKMGLPLAMGFVAKEYLLKAMLESAWWGVTAAIAAAIAGGAAAWALGWRAFAGRAGEGAHHAHEAPWAMRAPALVLAVAGVVLMPAMLVLGDSLVAAAASTVAATGAPAAKAWPGTDLVLALSLGLAAVGLTLGTQLPRLRRIAARIPWPGGGVLFDRALDSILILAKHHTRVVVNGHLRSYVAILISVGTGALATGLVLAGGDWSPPPTTGHILELPALLLILGGLTGVVLLRERVAAVVALGALGAGMALSFLGRGAPDLALTQILVEALTVLLMVLAFRALPKLGKIRRGIAGWWTAGLAAAFGVTIGLALMAVTHGNGVGAEYHTLSWTEAYGRNVVNVILVDFRAFDTLGEIAVLGLAAIGVIAVLGQRLRMKGGAS